MKFRLALFAVLVVFDVAVALVTCLGLITPALAVCLLLANPIALVVERQLRVNSPAGAGRARRR